MQNCQKNNSWHSTPKGMKKIRTGAARASPITIKRKIFYYAETTPGVLWQSAEFGEGVRKENVNTGFSSCSDLFQKAWTRRR